MKMIGLFLLIASMGSPVFSQYNWELVKDKNGIKIFTAKQEGSKHKLVKVSALLPGKIEKVEILLQTPESNTKWIYKTKESYVVKRKGKEEIINYSSISLPWPATDRDLVAKSTFYYHADKSFKVILDGVSGMMEEKKGYVRVPYFHNTWEVKSDGKGNVAIDYFLQIDPGGSLPAWVINLFVAKGPYETFNNLAALIK